MKDSQSRKGRRNARSKEKGYNKSETDVSSWILDSHVTDRFTITPELCAKCTAVGREKQEVLVRDYYQLKPIGSDYNNLISPHLLPPLRNVRLFRRKLLFFARTTDGTSKHVKVNKQHVPQGCECSQLSWTLG